MNDPTPEVTDIMIASEAFGVPATETEIQAAVKSGTFAIRRSDSNVSQFAYAHNRSVIVTTSAGSRIHRFAVEYAVQTIMYTTFPRTKDDPKDASELHCLAVIGDQDITFFNEQDGHPYTYYVPFKIRNVYQMKHGILIEQAWVSEEEFRMHQEEHIYLYSLTHPLNELLPMLYRPREFIGHWLFCWEQEEISLIEAFDDLVLTFDRVSQLHRLYHLRRTSEDEIKSSLNIFRNGHQRTDSQTPKGPAHSTPKVGFDGGAPSVQTRSMLRLARTRTFPLDSPALSNIGTPLNNNLTAESSFRQRSATHPSLMSSFGPNMTRLLTRDLNNDLFYADFCLECIWTEPNRKELVGSAASKAFLSQSMCRQIFVNYYVAEAKQMRCFRLADFDHKTIIHNSFGTVTCLDATILAREKHTVVLESDRYLTLYSGHTKVGSISYPNQLEGIRSLQPAFDESVAVVSPDYKLHMLAIRPLYGDCMVEQLFSTCLSTLTVHDKANALISQWRVFNAHEGCLVKQPGNDYDLLHAAFRFLLEQIGITIDEHPLILLPKAEPQMEQPQAKIKKPPMTREEMLARVRGFGKSGYPSLCSGAKIVRVTVDTSKPLFTCFQPIFAGMHSAWQQWSLEDGQLNRQSMGGISGIREQLVEYLRIGANVMKHEHLANLYEMEFPRKCDVQFSMTVKNDEELSFPKNPFLDNTFNLFSVLGGLIQGAKESCRFPSQIFTYSPRIAQFILAIAVGLNCVTSQVDLVRLLGKKWKKLMPDPAESNIQKLIIDKKTSAEEKCANLLALFSFKAGAIDKLPSALGLLVGKIVLLNRPQEYPPLQQSDFEFPTAQANVDISLSRWNDKRMENVRDMLRSDQQVLINTPALTDPQNPLNVDERELQEQFLHGTCIRYLAQAFGRSMKEFRTRGELPTYPDGAPLPELCLQARLFPSNMTYEIPLTETNKPYVDWGCFYGGVACALVLGHSSVAKLDSEYIISLCVKQDKLNLQTYAGMIYGFALNGHVLSSTYHITELLITMNEFQSVAILLGYGVARMGSGDIKIYKMLGTQLPFLFGDTTLNISIPHLNQTAAMSGLGLLFAQTGNHALIKQVIGEICAPFPNEEAPAPDRYAYRLSAGFTIGLIILAQGNKYLARKPPFIEPQPSLIDRLIGMILGHPKSVCAPAKQTVHMADFPMNYHNPPSFHYKDTDRVNTHLTGHGSCVALGLMFFKTNNWPIAKQVSLPDTVAQLEQIVPDLILSRLICYHLIMWDSIRPAVDFIQSLVPESVEEYLNTKQRFSLEKEEHLDLLEEADFDDVVDLESLCQVYVYVIAATTFVMGLRYKNSKPEEKKKAYDTLMFYAKQFLPTNKRRSVEMVLTAAGSNAVSCATNSILISLGMLMTNTGDIETIRAARVWRVNEPVITWMKSHRKHQEQVFSHEVLGMLFLGDGRYAFKEDDLSNALLLMAFYPILCHSVHDNRFYHQPLRFLWTQAVEPRLVVPFNSMKDPIKADLEITYVDGAVYRLKTPAVLPPLEMLSHVKLSGQDLETLKFDLTVERQRDELRNYLNKGHGRIPLNELKSHFVVNTDNDVIRMPQFKFELPEDFKKPEPGDTRLIWSSLESMAGMRRHLDNLTDIMNFSKSQDRVVPELYFAETLANWAGEDRLEMEVEHIIDLIKTL